MAIADPERARPTGPDSTPELPAQEPSSLARFLGPRYWITWIFVGWLRLMAVLPWRVSIAVHQRLGLVLWHLAPSRRHIVLRNLELCFPLLSSAEHTQLARRYFENFGACIAEIAIAWFGTVPRSRPPVRVEGMEHLEAALAKGRGVILYSGHFTTIELTAQLINSFAPSFAFMFKRRNNALLDALQTRGRRRTAQTSFNNGDVRGMLRMLERNHAIWYAPDQAHFGRSALLLPFFGEPAMTNTATVRLAKLSGAAVVPLFANRLPGGAGYYIRFEPALDALPSGDVEADQRQLGSILERFVQECPEQYLWTHRKFKGRPGLPDPYKTAPATATTTGDARSSRFARFALTLFVFAVALFIAATANGTLWREALAATALDEHRFGIVWTLFALLVGTITFGLALVPGRRPLKAAAAALLVTSAVCSYFMREYGIVIDESMIRNTVETTVLEATPLLGGAFFVHLLFFGMLPAAVVWMVPLPRQRWLRGLASRFAIAGASIVLIVGSLYANYGAVAFFGREHHTIRLHMNPAYPLYATARYFIGESTPSAREPLVMQRAAAEARRPTLVVLVVGETARADRFSYNGYERDTNRFTREQGVVNFPNVRSCGTSTADSLPCLFSHLRQARFKHDAANSNEPWYRSLGRLGIGVYWRDNSTGCKDVCEPENFAQYADVKHPTLCDATGCFDEILLEDFDALLQDRGRDHFIVLHQRGSHGPAYHTDVPKERKEYLPECDLPTLRNCTRDTINNAYDNTILYTDYFLSRVIATLEARSAEFDTAMLYVSDHGESLGENGLYLHGLPYALAPEEQKRIPMLFWGSPGFMAERLQATPECLAQAATRPTSHDAIMHTVLPWFGVETPLYDASLDVFAACRSAARSAPPALAPREASIAEVR